MSSRLIQLINLCLEKNIPFVSYSLPGENNIQTWIQLSGKFNFFESIHEVVDKEGFIYAPFHRRTNFPVVFFEPELIIENENFEDSLIVKISNKPSMYPEYGIEELFEVKREEYLKQANSFINSFHENFRKAILSRIQIEKKPKNFDTGKFFINLQKTYPNAFCHLINIPGAGVWAGASPEYLMRIQEDTAKTISLAGTQPYPGIDQIVNWEEKEIEEQKIVSDYVESVLKEFGIEGFKKGKTKNLVAGNAVHLATKFSFDKSLIEEYLGKFISTLHPTPAVCGLPKDKALELILQTEKHNREYYAGFCGSVNYQDKTDLFVNLRCMKMLEDKLALFVGGGLTSKSDPQKEWDETVLKAKTLLSIIGKKY